MWIAYALGAAVFAGLTAILAKVGVQTTPSSLATALRTVVVLIGAWVMVLIVGSAHTVVELSPQTWIFLILSGLATGASWLCYFRALQLGPVAKVAVIDKSSIVLTVLFAIVLLQETDDLAGKLIGIALIGAGTYLMVEWRDRPDAGGRGSWIVFAQDAQLGFTHASERSEEVGWWSSRSRGQGFPFCDRRYILDFSHVIVEGGHHGQVSCHLHRIPRHNRRGV